MKRTINELLIIITPLFISNLSITILTFVDRYFFSQYDEMAFAASVPAGLLSYALMSILIYAAGFTSVLFSYYYGKNDNANITNVFFSGILFSVIAGIIIILMIPIGHIIINFLGTNKVVINYQKTYFTVLMFGGGFMVTIAILVSYLSGTAQMKYVLIVTLITNLFNVILDYALIFGKFGLPELGILGGALATVIANFITIFIYIYQIFFNKQKNHIDTNYILFSPKTIKNIIYYAIPKGTQNFIDLAAWLIFIFLISKISILDQLSTNIVISLERIFSMPVMSFGVAIGILTSRSIGANDIITLNSIKKSAAYIALLYVALIYFLLSFYAEAIISIFSTNQNNHLIFESKQLAIFTTRYVLPILLTINIFLQINSGILEGFKLTIYKLKVHSKVMFFLFIPAIMYIAILGNFSSHFYWGAYLIYAGVLLIFFSKKSSDILAESKVSNRKEVVLE
jgi:MATE family multidrug resistance protein